jgi:hypothetical protein
MREHALADVRCCCARRHPFQRQEELTMSKWIPVVVATLAFAFTVLVVSKCFYRQQVELALLMFLAVPYLTALLALPLVELAQGSRRVKLA